MESKNKKRLVGRGSQLRTSGRFESVKLVHLSTETDTELPAKVATEFFEDASQSIVSTNNSPDLHFNFSLNPYRGCVHGCSYCYARPTHEYLGWGPGFDFESKIVVKRNAGKLFRDWMVKRQPEQIEPVMISGVTDCYQAPEKQFRVTRDCLEAALKFRHPIQIITKNKLILRDLDLLAELARMQLVSVRISITSLDQSLIRVMEPRTSSPLARLETVAKLSEANIPTSVFLAPIIPGINDEEIPELLRQASQHGATEAGYIMLRLPLTVQEVFVDWLETHFPDRCGKVLSRIESLRDGKLNSPVFGERMKGTGIWAEQIRNMFQVFANKYKLSEEDRQLRCDLFRKTDEKGRTQGELF